MFSQQIADEIYGLFCPDSGELRYIGKASDSEKRLKTHMRERRRQSPLYSWIHFLRLKGLMPVMRVLACTSDWRACERAMIQQHRDDGTRLLNLADGGDEPMCSPEQRAENGRNNSRKLHSDPRARRIWELKQALGVALRRGHLPEETKAKLRRAALLKPEVFGAWANV